LHQHDDISDPQLEDSDGSDPGELDEDEQQDAALQAEWSARALAFQVLSQLGHDQSSMTLSHEELEMGDAPTSVSCIESIKFTREFIEEIRAATFENGNLDEDVSP
jgi:hypothetical protein